MRFQVLQCIRFAFLLLTVDSVVVWVCYLPDKHSTTLGTIGCGNIFSTPRAISVVIARESWANLSAKNK